MEIIGRIIQVLPEQTGKSAKGEWKKQEFILEIPAQFPKKLCIASWNDKVDLRTFDPNKSVKVFFDLESREFNGRWYTDVKAWKLEVLDSAGSPAEIPGPEPTGDLPWDAEAENDLPF